MNKVFIIGDLHGQLDKVIANLRHAELLDTSLAWSGRDTTLCFMGDYFDRGPDGIGCVNLVMRLQREAAAAGGQVIALMGNHEPLLLAARRFGDEPLSASVGTFRRNWERNGGRESDLVGLTSAHVAWISALPAIATLRRRLLIHADALFYSELGDSVQTINQTISSMLTSDEPWVWEELFYVFSDRLAFFSDPQIGRTFALELLARFDCDQIIHGHTPIPYMSGRAPAEITGAFVYAGGLCVNVDGGMYMGGPGFVYELP
jgi:hypothetical protein